MNVYTWNLDREQMFEQDALPVEDRLAGLKYISFLNHRGEHAMLVFWRQEMHLDMLNRKLRRGDALLGAGFIVKDDDGRLACGGHSESLGLGPAPGDTPLMLEWAEIFST